MSDIPNDPQVETEVETPAEAPSRLDTLKQRADMLGLKYHHKIGETKLAEQIAAHLADDVPEEPQPAREVPSAAVARSTQLAEKKKKANKLVRVRVTCMNPNKREWEGEIIACGNRYFGNIKKYIPFDNAEGWHMPSILVDLLKSKKCQIFVERRNERGEKYKQGRLIPEYNVEILPDLSREQLEELARKQALSHAIDSNAP